MASKLKNFVSGEEISGTNKDGSFNFGPKRLYFLRTAITGNSTAVPAEAGVGSWAITNHATGRDKLFVSDGTKWQDYGEAAGGITDLVLAAADPLLGVEETTNGTFDTNPAVEWDLNGGWSWDEGNKRLIKAPGDTDQVRLSGGLDTDESYRVSLDIGGTVGTLSVRLDAGTSQEFPAGAGSVSFDGVWSPTSPYIIVLAPSLTFDGWVDNVSVKSINQATRTIEVAPSALGSNLVIKAGEATEGIGGSLTLKGASGATGSGAANLIGGNGVEEGVAGASANVQGGTSASSNGGHARLIGGGTSSLGDDDTAGDAIIQPGFNSGDGAHGKWKAINQASQVLELNIANIGANRNVAFPAADGQFGLVTISPNAAPSVAPTASGLFWVKQDTGNLYFSKGIAVVGDWILLNP